MDDLGFLTDKEKEITRHLASTILGVAPVTLTSRFFREVDSYILSLEDFLQNSIRRLLGLVNMRILVFLMVGSFQQFVNLKYTDKLRYLKKWKTSKLTLFRTGYITLQSLFGWGFYILEEPKEETGHLGPTIGREHQLPTLLEGKEKWSRSEQK